MTKKQPFTYNGINVRVNHCHGTYEICTNENNIPINTLYSYYKQEFTTEYLAQNYIDKYILFSNLRKRVTFLDRSANYIKQYWQQLF